MAARFEEAGLASVGRDRRDARPTSARRAIQRLEAGKLQALFTVDLFNEGVDIPRVDTVLFLRPTESATVFLQQLGRGLRLHREKPCLTVLDFIGNARQEFRFDRRFRALVGGTTRQVERQIEAGLPVPAARLRDAARRAGAGDRAREHPDGTSAPGSGGSRRSSRRARAGRDARAVPARGGRHARRAVREQAELHVAAAGARSARRRSTRRRARCTPGCARSST